MQMMKVKIYLVFGLMCIWTLAIGQQYQITYSISPSPQAGMTISGGSSNISVDGGPYVFNSGFSGSVTVNHKPSGITLGTFFTVDDGSSGTTLTCTDGYSSYS